MSSLRAQRVCFSFTDAVALFTDAELALGPGWTGVVGPNGAGKSTLLQLISGALRPSSGSLQIEPPGARVRLCPQTVETLDPALERFAESSDPLARRLLGQLHLDPLALARWDTLSPGERKRWQVGAALAEEPEILLLDEPTNHLDAQARGWLEGALRRFRGLGLLVSHDRSLLDSLTTQTLKIEGGALRVWPGRYTEARSSWEAEAAGRTKEREQRKSERDRAERQLDEARRAQQAASRNVHVGRRMKGPRDTDAQSMGRKVVAGWADKTLGKKVGALREQSARAAASVPAFEEVKAVGRSVFVGYERAPKPWLLALERPELAIADRVLLGELNVALGREDRVWLSGENGAGKTTLVGALLEAPRIPLERLLFLPQELRSDEAVQTLDEVRALPAQERGRVLSLVAALGVDPARLLASSSPSPGEARKLRIAQGLGRHAWALVLDEPTNHLDLPSIERLEAALSAYPGALLLVTHDERFARACTRTRWTIAGGKLEIS